VLVSARAWSYRQCAGTRDRDADTRGTAGGVQQQPSASIGLSSADIAPWSDGAAWASPVTCVRAVVHADMVGALNGVMSIRLRLIVSIQAFIQNFFGPDPFVDISKGGTLSTNASKFLLQLWNRTGQGIGIIPQAE